MTGLLHAVQTCVNPAALDVDAYLRLLQQCFGAGWDRRAFQWYCARPSGGEPADLLVRASGQQLLAGISLACREVRVGTAPPVKVGMLGAAATLPAARGAGHYSALLLAAIERARQRGCVALVSFATQQNRSWRGLQKLGAVLLPSAYLCSTDASRVVASSQCAQLASGSDPVNHFLLERARQVHDQRWGRDADGAVARFVYSRMADWRSQFIDRTHAVRALRPAAGCLALVENVGDTDRLQWLDCPPALAGLHLQRLAAASAAAGRRFFAFTTAPNPAVARQARLAPRPGWLILQPTGVDEASWRQLASARWQVQSGDRL